MGLRVALIGCGKIADGHAGEIAKLTELGKLVAVCDSEPLMAEQLATRFGVRGIYADLGEMLRREQPDVLHVTTPPASHLPLARQALAAGCHLYVEKPLAPTHEDALTLLAEARRAGRKLTAGYSYLFDPPARALRELVASGALGELVHLEAFYGYDLAGPFGTAVMADAGHWVHGLPGQLLQNNLDHLLYKLAEYFEDDHPRLSAFGVRRRPQRFGDARDIMADELRLMLCGERLTASAVFSSFTRPMTHTLRLYGTRNTAAVDFLARTLVLESTTPLPSALGRLLPAFERSWKLAREGLRNLAAFRRYEFHYFSGLNHLIAAFYRSILENGDPPIPYRTLEWSSELMSRLWSELPRFESAVPSTPATAKGDLS